MFWFKINDVFDLNKESAEGYKDKRQKNLDNWILKTSVYISSVNNAIHQVHSTHSLWGFLLCSGIVVIRTAGEAVWRALSTKQPWTENRRRSVTCKLLRTAVTAYKQ